MRTTIKRTFVRSAGTIRGPMYYIIPAPEAKNMKIELKQEPVTNSFISGERVFELTHVVHNQNIFVYFNGDLQDPSVYHIDGKYLTILTDIPEGWSIDVVYTTTK